MRGAVVQRVERGVIAHGPIGRFRNVVLHDSYRDLDRQLGKLGNYATLMAESMAANGRRADALRLLLNPLWRLIRAYVLRRGYLDGWRGFAIAQIEANYVWEKYLRPDSRFHIEGANSVWLERGEMYVDIPPQTHTDVAFVARTAAGTEVVLDRNQPAVRRPIDGAGTDWARTYALTPDLDLENRQLIEFLR